MTLTEARKIAFNTFYHSTSKLSEALDALQKGLDSYTTAAQDTLDESKAAYYRGQCSQLIYNIADVRQTLKYRKLQTSAN